MTEPQWLLWSRQLMAVAQNGLTYASNPFDIDRYQSVRKIAAAILAEHSRADQQRIENLFAQEAGYATPKVDVRGVVFRDQALLAGERAGGRPLDFAGRLGRRQRIAQRSRRSRGL